MRGRRQPSLTHTTVDLPTKAYRGRGERERERERERKRDRERERDLVSPTVTHQPHSQILEEDFSVLVHTIFGIQTP